MGVLVSLVIITAAAGTIVAVMIAVLREKHEHEEWFIPPEPAETPAEAPSSTVEAH